ncbi:transposase, partial [Streptomyces sp. NPDC001255]|uniref:transposase n=1 Tax=Streptomyces sp. NPDC001255 TaxID=3364550 RepID=UPI00367837FB
MDRIAGRFARVELRRRVRHLVLGLLSDLSRKNCWTIAEWAGDTSPHGMQNLLCRAVWDADGIRDDVREYVVEHLYDGAAVLVVDETGDVKKGTHTVGVRGSTSMPCAPTAGHGLSRLHKQIERRHHHENASRREQLQGVA